MRHRVGAFLRGETILIVATLLALISCFIVPPDWHYREYVHVSTIAQLICLMLVVCGLQRVGVFRIIGAKLLEHVDTARGLVLTFISLTFFSSMLITNDVALLTFVPFALAVLKMAKMEDRAILVCTLMTIGANTGSMLTPIGNAHNLYFKALTGMSTGHFLAVMGPYTAVSAAMLIAITCIVFRGRRLEGISGMDSKSIEHGVLAPDSTKPQPDEIHVTGYGAGYGGWRVIVYAITFIVCVLAVGDLIPLWVMCVVVFAVMMVCDRRSFRHADWGLPLTFIMFFIFIGHEACARIRPARATVRGRAPARRLDPVQPGDLQRADLAAARRLLERLRATHHRHEPRRLGHAHRLDGFARHLQALHEDVSQPKRQVPQGVHELLCAVRTCAVRSELHSRIVCGWWRDDGAVAKREVGVLCGMLVAVGGNFAMLAAKQIRRRA